MTEQETGGGSGAPSAVSNVTKATMGGGAAGVVLPYLAYLAAQKWGVPFEVSSAMIGAGAALFSRWAARLPPGG